MTALIGLSPVLSGLAGLTRLWYLAVLVLIVTLAAAIVLSVRLMRGEVDFTPDPPQETGDDTEGEE
ncbi:MAG: hypothetical protein IJ055_08000 [Oscillospiraceae bacterium]|nr:hypothetical protein [Oscillospiraceae bacterium]